MDIELFPIPNSRGNKWELVKKGTYKPLKHVVVCNAVIKYLPLKYNKITVQLVAEEFDKFLSYQDLFKEDLQVEPFLKYDTIALKLGDEVKSKTTGCKVGDHIKIAVEFNGVWKINNKLYASWQMVDFKPIEQLAVCYFE